MEWFSTNIVQPSPINYPIFSGTFFQLKCSLESHADELENISSNERRVMIQKNRRISLLAEAPSTKNLQSLLFGLYKAGDETLEADIYHNSYTLWKKNECNDAVA